jgi:hypothetical protein
MQNLTRHPAVRVDDPELTRYEPERQHTRSEPPPAAANQLYHQRLKAELGELVDQLELSPLQKRCVRARWLDTVLWMEGRANATRNHYYRLRLTIIGDGVLVPALISLDLAGVGAEALRWATVVLSLVVAISAAVEGFFRFGERWRHYRRTVELLKTEGWQFFQQSGRYADAAGHAEAFPAFAGRVEDIIESNVETYVTEIARERDERKEDAAKP